MKTSYEEIGGAETVRALVDAFYERVYAHEELIPLFPKGVEAVKEKQYLFMTQFLGGPTLYTEQEGAKNIREFHYSFPITPAHAKAWLQCMKEAMDEIGMEGMAREMFYQRLTHIATVMVSEFD